jgi:hypothetical protein
MKHSAEPDSARLAIGFSSDTAAVTAAMVPV